MRILAVDTTTRSCSVAVAENSTVLGEITNISDQTHSRHLLDLIHTVIQDAGLTLSAGTVVFSGTVFVLALGGPRWFGAITPVGGSLMILGFVFLAFAAWRA